MNIIEHLKTQYDFDVKDLKILSGGYQNRIYEFLVDYNKEWIDDL